MSRSALLVKECSKQIDALLKALGTFGDKQLKNLANEAKKNLAESADDISKIDFKVVSQPFINAMKSKDERVLKVSYGFFATLFSFSDSTIYPNKQITEAILNVIVRLDPNCGVELRLECCKAVKEIVISYPGRCYIHANLLYSLITFLVLLHESSRDNELVTEVAEMTIKEVLIINLNQYGNPVSIPALSDDIAEYSKQVIKTLVFNSLQIIQYVPEPNYSASVRDVDVVGAIHAFAKAVEFQNFSPKTMVLVLSTVDSILNSRFAFYEKPFFKSVLQTDIHNMLMTAIGYTHYELALPTAAIILSCWEFFSHYYFYQLNDILEKGILKNLDSDDQMYIKKAAKMIRLLASKDQFFVDCFINYDCDNKGQFTHIFADTVQKLSQLVRKYDGKSVKVQKSCLIALSRIFESMWRYHQSMTNKQNEVSPYLNVQNAITLFQQCAHAFAIEPQTGFDMFIKHGFTKESPGKFLAQTLELDKVSIGFILGNQDEKIINDFLQEVEKEETSFELCFVKFFSRFVLPTDQNRCERIIRRFSVWFFSVNNKTISSVDTVYALTLAALQIHISNNITLEKFIENTHNIDRGNDLPRNLIQKLYAASSRVKIILPQNSLLMSSTQMTQHVTSQANQALSNALAITQSIYGTQFDRSENPLLIGPMFESIWGDVFDLVKYNLDNELNTYKDKEVIELCLRIIINSIHITSHCYLDNPLQEIIDYSFGLISSCWAHNDTFVPKRLYGTLSEDAPYLRTIWPLFIQNISKMSRSNESPVQETLEVALTAFERVGKFDRDALISISNALCQISKDELAQLPPNDYCLKLLIHICKLSVGRPIFIWKSLWSISSLFLGTAGATNREISKYIVDSIISLLYDYIMKSTENEGFHIEEEILEPIFSIFTKTTSDEIKLDILETINYLLKDQNKALLSGWEVILQIISSTAAFDESISLNALDLLERILIDYMNNVKDYMVHVISALSAFALNESLAVNIRSISLFSVIAKTIEDDSTWSLFWDLFFRSVQSSQSIQQEMFVSTFIEIISNVSLTSAQWNYILTTGSMGKLPDDQKEKIQKCVDQFVPEDQKENLSVFYSKI